MDHQIMYFNLMHQEIIVIIIIIKMAYSITRATNQIMLKRSIMV